MKSLSPLDDLIVCLEKQTIETKETLLSNVGSDIVLADILKAGEAQSKIPCLEEALSCHARLKQRTEFMYTFKMLVYLLFHTRDFNKLSHLLTDFRRVDTDDENEMFDETIFTRFWLGESQFTQPSSASMTIRYNMGYVTSSGPLNIERGLLFRECVVPVLKQAIVTCDDGNVNKDKI